MRSGIGRRIAPACAAALSLALAMPVVAQIRTIDPNRAPPAAAGGDAATVPQPAAPAPPDAGADAPPAPPEPPYAGARAAGADPRPSGALAADPAGGDARAQAAAAAAGDTYQQKDVIDAAEGVFGKGAQGLAKLIEDIFRKQGRPTAYIAGREAGGAVIAGVRYGSGTLFHKVEGRRPIHWTGPSIGFDLGANGAKTFVLVYNLYDTQELYRRFPAAEGNLYAVGGFTASYLRWGKVVVIPIRLGVGWRFGANLGYMKFTERSRWSPF